MRTITEIVDAIEETDSSYFYGLPEKTTHADKDFYLNLTPAEFSYLTEVHKTARHGQYEQWTAPMHEGLIIRFGFIPAIRVKLLYCPEG